MDKKSNNEQTDKASAGERQTANQPITQSNWNLLVRNGHLDSTRTPASQGYQIVDEVSAVLGGPTNHQRDLYAVSSGDEDSKHNTGGNAQAHKGHAPSRDVDTASRASSSSTRPPTRQMWSDEEVNELVRLRCRGLTYPAIAKNHLPGRDLKAIQLKFAKLNKTSPYKQQWEKYKHKQFRRVEEEEEEEDEDTEREDYEGEYEDPDEEPKKDFGPGGPGGSNGGAQGGAQAIQVY